MMPRRKLTIALTGLGLMTATLAPPAPGFTVTDVQAALASVAPSPAAGPALDDGSIVVTMKGDRFRSDFNVVTVGTTVTWQNDDRGATGVHNVYAEDGSFGS